MPSSSERKARVVNRKWRPSGRNHGQRWLVSLRAVSIFVISRGVPPSAETARRGPLGPGEKRIIPSEFQLPPRPSAAGQMVCTGPPCASTLFSLAPAKKPIVRLSDDQKG